MGLLKLAIIIFAFFGCTTKHAFANVQCLLVQVSYPKEYNTKNLLNHFFKSRLNADGTISGGHVPSAILKIIEHTPGLKLLKNIGPASRVRVALPNGQLVYFEDLRYRTPNGSIRTKTIVSPKPLEIDENGMFNFNPAEETMPFVEGVSILLKNVAHAVNQNKHIRLNGAGNIQFLGINFRVVLLTPETDGNTIVPASIYPILNSEQIRSIKPARRYKF